uniref:Laccase 44 n=1 Tax=Salvia miltiorrhiza TaxID=226208 RepID=A0A4Y5RSN7_SALMI|nr:laccase 44 [Salvia miltiorrhiza]
MPQYPWSDGTNYVTQCPIEPGQKFTQQIILSDEEGTLWWHAHSDWARNSVYGAIVILPPRTESFPFPTLMPISPHPNSSNAFLSMANQATCIHAQTKNVHQPELPSTSPTTPTTVIIEYVGNYTPPPSPLLPSFPDVGDSAAVNNFINRLRSLGNDVDVPKKVEEFLFYTLSMNLMPCLKSTCSESTRLLASVNNVSLVLPRQDILQAYYRGINGVYTEDFPDFPHLSYDFTGVVIPEEEAGLNFGTAVRMLEYNTTVEVVFQGANLHIEHPIHLHGYSFYVVGSGLGNYNRIRDLANYNLVDPPLMQTIAVPKSGWTAIRFKANNPGVWYLHCHIERHITWGMGMVFIVKDGERRHEKMLPPPPDMPRC